MGIFGLLWFSDENKELVKEIVKVNKIGEEHYELVEKLYKEMLDKISDELHAEKED